MLNFLFGFATKSKSHEENTQISEEKNSPYETSANNAESKHDGKAKKTLVSEIDLKADEEDAVVLQKFWHRIKIRSNKKKVFLLLGGSFNPVHKEHIEILEIAKRHCEKRLNNFVVAGFLGVSSANHVKRKLGLGNAITLNHRNKMCDLAVEKSDWISVCHFGWPNATRIGSRLQRSIWKKDKDIKIDFLCVMGSDIFGNVMPGERGFAPYHKGLMNYICVNRDHSKVFEAVKKLKDNHETFHFTEESTIGSVSSTKVRELLQAGHYEELQKYLDPKVIVYLKQNIAQLWESCIKNDADDELLIPYDT